MKKMLFISAAAGILAFGGITLADGDDSTPRSSGAELEKVEQRAGDADDQSFLSFSEAEQIAKAQAGGDPFDIRLSEDDDDPHYIVELSGERSDRKFEIDALDGAIRQVESKPAPNASDQTASAKVQQNAELQLIGKQQAIEVARSVATGVVEDVELEKDDGEIYYEVEFEDGKMDYEVTVDAVEGVVLSVETDDDDDDRNDDNDDDDNDEDDKNNDDDDDE